MPVLVEMDGYVQGTSVSSVAIGTGQKSFTLDDDEPFEEGMTISVNDGTENNILDGTITSYNSTTKLLVMNVTATTGSGTISSWVIGGERTFRYSDTGYKSRITDSIGAKHFAPQVQDPGNFEQYLVSPGTTFGKSSVGKGDTVLKNASGEIDYLRRVGINKRFHRILTLPSQTSSYDDATEVFSGTMEQLTFNWTKTFVRMKDRLADLDVPAQQMVFAGTNVGSSGIEGNVGGIKGYTKPFVYGSVENITPALLNSSTLIFGCNFDKDGNTKAIQLVNAVYDNGVELLFYANYADLASLVAASIPSGYYGSCYNEGLIKPSSSPAGTLTADITEGSTAAQRTAAQITRRILEERGSYTSSNYESAAFTSMDTLDSSVCGIYVTDSTSILDACVAVLDGVGGVLYVTEDDKFTVDLLRDEDDDASVETFINKHLSLIDRITSKDPGNGIPAKQTKVWYRKNYTKQTASEIAGSVSDVRRLFVENEERSVVSSENLAVVTKHPNAPIIEFHTLLTNESNAITANTRRNTIYSQERDWFRIRVPLTETSVIRQLNDVVTIQVDRFRLNLGKKFRIMGRILYFAKPYVEYVVWGKVV